jgi:hypothetical protein
MSEPDFSPLAQLARMDNAMAKFYSSQARPDMQQSFIRTEAPPRAHWPAWLSSVAIGAGITAFIFVVAPLLIVAAGAASRAVYYLFMIGWGQ